MADVPLALQVWVGFVGGGGILTSTESLTEPSQVKLNVVERAVKEFESVPVVLFGPDIAPVEPSKAGETEQSLKPEEVHLILAVAP